MDANEKITIVEWTDESTEWFKEHYARLTCSQLLFQLHQRFGMVKTRNAICGKAHRLGLTKPVKFKKGPRTNAALVKAGKPAPKFDVVAFHAFVRLGYARNLTDAIIAIEATEHFNTPVAIYRVARAIAALGLRIENSACSKSKVTHKQGEWTRGIQPTRQDPLHIDLNETQAIGIPFADAGDDACMWPMARNMVCGCKRLSGLSYCTDHASRSYRQAPSPARARTMQREQLEYRKAN